MDQKEIENVTTITSSYRNSIRDKNRLVAQRTMTSQNIVIYIFQYFNNVNRQN